MSEDKKQLYYLDELSDYKVKNEDPDVRGWDMKDHDNRVIGKVNDLLVHKKLEKVMYLDVEVDQTIIDADHDPYAPGDGEIREFVNKEGENHLIVPIGLVDIDETHKFVRTHRLDHRTFAETKRMRAGAPIERDYEVVILESYDRKNNNDDYESREARRQKIEKKLAEERANDPDYKENHDPVKDPRAEGTFKERRYKGRFPDDDSLYERREFDRRNFKKRI